MTDFSIKLLDSSTAATLSQVLPLLLLTLAVEARRIQLHREISPVRRATFFAGFGLIETILVLSIDGALFPFQWFDAFSALIIFFLLGMVFRLSLMDAPDEAI